MRSYDEIVQEYQKRRRDTLVDSIAASLTYTDEICMEAGLLHEAGILDDLLNGVFAALPFVLIAVTEQYKVVLGRKPAKTGLKDAAFRMVKTGVAMGVGACVAGAAGLAAAIPATIGVRALFDSYRSRLFIGRRVMMRTQRLKELHSMMAPPIVIQEQILLTDGEQNMPSRK